MVKKDRYFQVSKKDFEYEVRHSKVKNYFSPETKKFFGSKVKEDDVFVNNDKTKYIFKEKLNNAPSGANNIKIGLFDKKKGNIEDLYFGTSNKTANKILKEKLTIKKNE